ncbi:MAG: restriction endonuclease [Chloroflexi bacterium]|nr:restriction endonuclease [Chloroflexota bacterium]
MYTLSELRDTYHAKIGSDIVRYSERNGSLYPNFADVSSQSSRLIASGIAELIGIPIRTSPKITGQTAGNLFENLTCEFIESAFTAIQHLRPGSWQYLTNQTQISNFTQYQHLESLASLVSKNQALSAALGHGYIVTPDIVIARHPVTQEEANNGRDFLDDSGSATRTPFLSANQSTPHPTLHASISCKWTIRSDRSQNTRTEALNLIRNRKGNLPHIVAVTAEPLPMRIASLALGTGDIDCVYHFALDELHEVCRTNPQMEDQSEMLEVMVEGNRLRDISDLPFDIAV